MQVNTYRHFKKEDEIFMGLGLWTLAKIALTLIGLFLVAQSFQLSLNSFMFLVLAMFTMIIVSFIIKASQDNEVEGYYSTLFILLLTCFLILTLHYNLIRIRIKIDYI
jgi:hypothetical protein